MSALSSEELNGGTYPHKNKKNNRIPYESEVSIHNTQHIHAWRMKHFKKGLLVVYLK
jgi:hypothetical protein